MRRRVSILLLMVGVAGCGGGERDAASEATNATLFNEATVNALLGTGLPPEEPVASGNAAENGLAGNEADAQRNEAE